MADDFQVNIPTTSGDTFAADDIAGVKHQRVKIEVGADGSATDVSTSNPLPVSDAGGSITVDDGATTLSVDDGAGSLTVDGSVAITGTVAVTDNSGSLTVDNVALSVVGGGSESTALRVTIANDSTGVVSVDDNGSTLSIDDGAGSLTVDGTVTVQDGGGAISIDDNGGNISIDDGGNSITVDGTVSVSGTVTVGSHAVTNAGTFAVQDSEKVADNAGFTDGTTKVQPAGFIFDETAGTSLTENDAAAARIDSKRAIVNVIEDETTRGRRLTITSSNAAKVDGSGVTQPVSAASLPLPSGAATSAKQDTQITSLQLIDDAIYTEGDPSVSPKGAAVMGWDSGGGAVHAVSVDSSGSVKVVQQGSVTCNTELNAAAALADAAAANVSTATVGAVPLLMNATTVDRARAVVNGQDSTGTGIQAVGVVGQLDDTGTGTVTENQFAPVRISSRRALLVEGVASGTNVNVAEAGAALTALQLIDDPVIQDDSGFTPNSSKVMMAGFQADETSTDSVDEGDAGAARMTLDRKQIVTCEPHTAGGLDVGNFTSGDTFTALTNSAQAIKASAGQIYGWYIMNPNTSTAYVIVYDIAAASVTVGTSTPKLVFAIPAGAAANIMSPMGIPFATAISCAATTSGGGNTAPSTALEAMFFYK